jgi:hypothetical protein
MNMCTYCEKLSHFCFCPEIDFLDIGFTKGSSLLFHALHSLIYWRILKTTILFSGFKNPYKKIYETRQLESIRE